MFTLETTQVQQQDNLAVAQGNIALNLINVYRALGGGWEIRLDKENGRETPRMRDAGPDLFSDPGAGALPMPRRIP